jgi:hypothetical protein
MNAITHQQNVPAPAHEGNRILTLVEVAAEFRVTPRWLREVVRARKIPVLRKGRIIRFDRIALDALNESLRCRSASPAALPPAPLPSPALSPDAAFAAALRLTTRASPARKRPPSKPRSCEPSGTGNVVPLAHSAKRR